MKLTELIMQAQALKRDHGDLDVLDSDYFGIICLSLREFEQDSDEINVKAGDKVAQIKSDR